MESRERLKTTPCSECALNDLAIDDPLEYARLYLDGNMHMWIDAEELSSNLSRYLHPIPLLSIGPQCHKRLEDLWETVLAALYAYAPH